MVGAERPRFKGYIRVAEIEIHAAKGKYGWSSSGYYITVLLNWIEVDIIESD